VSEQKRYVIGIDGGGTKTNALIVGQDGTVVAECSCGPTQIQTFGVKLVAVSLFELIRECCNKVDCKPENLQSIVMGIAGAGRASDRTDLTDTLHSVSVKKKFLLKNITVETDARIALEAAFAGGPGIVVIAGTGSIALYRTEDGKLLRAGGWGKILGDEGSGYAIARDALNAVMRQYDGRGDKTDLTKKAMAHFKIDSHDELISKVYHDQTDIASFTPNVFEVVTGHDHVAHSILVRNATELAELVRKLIMQVRPKKKLPVALMGGLLESENPYSKIVKEKIISSLPNIVVQKPKFSAAVGATIIGLNAFR
jgi:N-acetylglucosamine kinase-like BadF-type ATPase